LDKVGKRQIIQYKMDMLLGSWNVRALFIGKTSISWTWKHTLSF